MGDLLDLVFQAHGGMDRWRQATTIHAKAVVGGVALPSRQQGDVFANTDLTLDVQRQRGVFANFTNRGRRGIYTPGRVAIEERDGTVLHERHDPRDAFGGLGPTSAWDQLHALYFGGYALWNYLTAPYLLTFPGVQTEEVEPWREAGEQWRRLRATFPPDIATHSTEQTFYYDDSGLLRRHDYRVEIQGKAPALAAHYTDAHRTVSGLVFPTHRYVVPVADDNTPLAGPIIISIDLAEINIE
ncbi:hypothetical protein [Plantactinospora sp. KLBMP9567]|uniref:hypothetical protein n=1 Tax=Plantactinospora sp. KLBMP9567 TaxID=3085900 RepID=UPI002981B46A|nr:hypothetical protein [Plantactinospora sp. KLBMP9567]MDW5329936.1 hypothetical protein [Plantactinospora sp. KLBMP9567]